MSVEKVTPFNPTISHEPIPYTLVYTEVIQNIDYPEAGFIYIYLLSKPKTWEVIKNHIKNKYGYGNDKIKKIFAYLNKSKLIEYVKTRDEKGILRKSEIRVLNGEKFIKNLRDMELSTENVSTGGIIHPLAKPPAGKQEPINKRNSLQIKEKEINLVCIKKEQVKKPNYRKTIKKETNWEERREIGQRHIKDIIKSLGRNLQ